MTYHHLRYTFLHIVDFSVNMKQRIIFKYFLSYMIQFDSDLSEITKIYRENVNQICVFIRVLFLGL